MVMIEKVIQKIEAEMLTDAINKIMSTEVTSEAIVTRLPVVDTLTDSNKVYCGKISVLFVDIRESTRLSEMFSNEQIVKIYRSYIRLVVQAVRYSGGVVRDFMGDGALAVFVDEKEDKSEDKAVHAARYITTSIDKILNPILDRRMKYRISCGIGIHTGEVSIAKVGMKGREQRDDAESEYGVAWIGNSTNLASKYSGAVDNGTIFIDVSTYAGLSSIEDKHIWTRVEISKGKYILSGYTAKHYYLPVDVDGETCPAGSTSTTIGLVNELQDILNKQLDDILKETKALEKLKLSLVEKGKELDRREASLNTKQRKNIETERELNEREYDFYCKVLASGHCKSSYVLEMGQDFWEDYLDKAIIAGSKLNINAHIVKQDVSYAMVSIYIDLGQYDKAYDFLVEQATGYPWLSAAKVEDVVKHTKRCDKLKLAIYARIVQGDLSPENQNEFEKIVNWLVFEYKG